MVNKLEKPATVKCPICGEVVEIPQYDKITKSDALSEHIRKEHAGYRARLGESNPMTKMDYPTVEQLIAEAPEVISKSTLGNLKQVFNLAKYRAETCALGKMADNLLFIGQGIDDIVDEMAYAFKKGRIESLDYDAYVRKIESFQWGTVPAMVKGAITSKCGCKLNNPGLIGPIVAATVTMQKLEEERRRKKARGW